MRTTFTAFALALLLAVPAIVIADETPTTADTLEKPSTAWQQINADARKSPRPQQRAKLNELSTYAAEDDRRVTDLKRDIAFKLEQIAARRAHITGGGITENLPRALPDGLGAEVNLDAIDPPGVFRWL